MSCTSCFNRSCPAPVNVEVHQTFLQLDGLSAVIDVYEETVVGTQVALPFAPLAGYPVKVLVNGLLQQAPDHYSISGSDITFVNALASDAVQVEYAHLAP